jgi:hypothetical protein
MKERRSDIIKDIDNISNGLLKIPLYNAINQKYYSLSDLIKIREIVKKGVKE